MATVERDPHTGHQTTGHEWNGIKELNTPVPRVVYFFLIATALLSFVYWILMPAWPLGFTYTKGLLGIDQRTVVAAALRDAAVGRTWAGPIESASFAEIESDPRLMDVVRQTGRTLFGDKCAVCHGRNAEGRKKFPSLTTASWLWGGTPEAIAETIRVGINSTHPDSRVSEMPAFGRDGILPREDIDKVIAYVLSLSAPSAPGASADQIAAGKTVYADNCASCHGDAGQGNTDLGAPNLADSSWINGGDPQSVLTTVLNGRQGHMPSWESRLSVVDRKILALYLVDLGKAAP